MQANPRSLDSLFNSQLRYVVPMFQRLYVWQENPQWATLWEDIAEKADLQLGGTRTNAHYLGALIIEGVRPSSPRDKAIPDHRRAATTNHTSVSVCITATLHVRTIGRHLTGRPRYLENADPMLWSTLKKSNTVWLRRNRNVFGQSFKPGANAVESQHPLVYLPRKRKPQPRNNLVEAYLYF